MANKRKRKNSNYTKEKREYKEKGGTKTIYRIGALVLVGALIVGMIAMYGFRF
ncbi:MAG: hypothetical protein IJG85_07660 [Eubacteriaceae bacterium]|nr:hypothetical protein [Eubacteriaceae bacterium]